MGWSIGYDDKWERDIGYGVPAWCDHPDCWERIDRGLAFVCGGQPYGGEHGCGLFFCEKHRGYVDIRIIGSKTSETVQLCGRCKYHKPPFTPKSEHPEWITHVLTHDSWHQWRAQHPRKVKAFQATLLGK